MTTTEVTLLEGELTKVQEAARHLHEAGIEFNVGTSGEPGS